MEALFSSYLKLFGPFPGFADISLANNSNYIPSIASDCKILLGQPTLF
jgi:hypothetical protein